MSFAILNHILMILSKPSNIRAKRTLYKEKTITWKERKNRTRYDTVRCISTHTHNLSTQCPKKYVENWLEQHWVHGRNFVDKMRIRCAHIFNVQHKYTGFRSLFEAFVHKDAHSSSVHRAINKWYQTKEMTPQQTKGFLAYYFQSVDANTACRSGKKRYDIYIGLDIGETNKEIQQ